MLPIAVIKLYWIKLQVPGKGNICSHLYTCRWLNMACTTSTAQFPAGSPVCSRAFGSTSRRSRLCKKTSRQGKGALPSSCCYLQEQCVLPVRYCWTYEAGLSTRCACQVRMLMVHFSSGLGIKASFTALLLCTLNSTDCSSPGLYLCNCSSTKLTCPPKLGSCIAQTELPDLVWVPCLQ